MLSHLRFWRERGWTPIDAADYADAWANFGGSVATHPEVVARLADLAGMPGALPGLGGRWSSCRAPCPPGGGISPCPRMC